jgi:hypothetical protein
VVNRIKGLSLTESKALARSIKTAAQYCLLPNEDMRLLRTFSVEEILSCPALNARLHSRKKTLGLQKAG